jgi:hypothetical protein
MGMCSYVKGVRDLDGKFKQMIDVKCACEAADIEYPQAVKNYFNECDPGCDVEDLRREMAEVDIDEACSEDFYDATAAYVVDISKLPEGITKIKFINSW